MYHGYWSYCSGGKCTVCNTQWPVKKETPTEKYLKSINYYSNYCNDFPCGLKGIEILEIEKNLRPEYIKEYGKIAR